jgi:hypothetical protein
MKEHDLARIRHDGLNEKWHEKQSQNDTQSTVCSETAQNRH